MHPGATIGQVYLCCLPVDFRKQIDGLAAMVEGELELNLFGDAMFVFANRQRSRIKILYWHRNGFCLWQKRLEKQRFAWPSREHAQSVCQVTARELQWLLEGFDPWKNSHKSLNYRVVS